MKAVVIDNPGELVTNSMHGATISRYSVNEKNCDLQIEGVQGPNIGLESGRTGPPLPNFPTIK